MTTPLRVALAAFGMVAAAQAAQAATIVGLTADNALVSIDSETRRAAAPVRITGTDGRVIGIDQRPQDGRLYGVTESGQIVTINPADGRATQVSRLNTAFASGGRAVVDFNPAANRLRLMGMNGVNLRVNVDTGEAVTDGTLKYAAGTPMAETGPRIVAGAYTNSMTGAQQTALYTIDTLSRRLNLQAPPNDGVQQPRGEVAATLPAGVAFDILSDGQGGNTTFLLADGTMHSVNLETGAATATGPVSGLPAVEVIDIAAMR
ncbi:DUF4394 domain-containing protein [Roseomonas terrae]|jgi:hypothetical protein|uniref:DUF4394 domain-containing protein n=1 Tax=Neoroseomonas terrae TaxID=424799 RepID=A0ABS5ECQ3_9PROT|nr:DUF4394 domain-containing protein [Neoroseomonas terrae]MBR0648798.1 DUF4394 domain-containing protein [Neoroseomonas terrae]